MDLNDPDYNKIFKRFASGVLYSMLITMILNLVICACTFHLDILASRILLIGIMALILINIIAIIVAVVIPATLQQKLCIPYIITVIVTLYPSTIFSLLANGNILLFFYFLTTIACFYVVYPHKLMSCIFWAFGLLLSAFGLSLILRYNIPAYQMENYTMPYFPTFLLYVMNIISHLFLISHTLYYIHRFCQMRILSVENKYKAEIERLQNIIITAENKKMKELMKGEASEKEKNAQTFAQIKEYLETQQPYLSSDFNLVQMSNDLKINIKYLSSAINAEEGMNFNCLVNSYRIAKVKEMMHADNFKRFTIQHIYLSAGFKNQASFNHAFKLAEGVTPSKYFNKLANND